MVLKIRQVHVFGPDAILSRQPEPFDNRNLNKTETIAAALNPLFRLLRPVITHMQSRSDFPTAPSATQPAYTITRDKEKGHDPRSKKG